MLSFKQTSEVEMWRYRYWYRRYTRIKEYGIGISSDSYKANNTKYLKIKYTRICFSRFMTATHREKYNLSK